MQEIAPYLVHDRAYETNDAEGNVIKTENFLKIDHSAMTWVLVNSVKEQQAHIEELEQEVEELSGLRTEVEILKEKLDQLIESSNSKDVTLTGDNNSYLGQNVPNPYGSETMITYAIPENFQSAEIRIYSVNGSLLKSVTINESGKRQINLEARDLANGNYTYSLIVDSKIIDTKKMVLAK